jgi:hypothetical protein
MRGSIRRSGPIGGWPWWPRCRSCRPGGGRRLHPLRVFTVTGGMVDRNVVFADPRVFEAFDLPAQIS